MLSGTAPKILLLLPVITIALHSEFSHAAAGVHAADAAGSAHATEQAEKKLIGNAHGKLNAYTEPVSGRDSWDVERAETRRFQALNAAVGNLSPKLLKQFFDAELAPGNARWHAVTVDPIQRMKWVMAFIKVLKNHYPVKHGRRVTGEHGALNLFYKRDMSELRERMFASIKAALSISTPVEGSKDGARKAKELFSELVDLLRARGYWAGPYSINYHMYADDKKTEEAEKTLWKNMMQEGHKSLEFLRDVAEIFKEKYGWSVHKKLEEDGHKYHKYGMSNHDLKFPYHFMDIQDQLGYSESFFMPPVAMLAVDVDRDKHLQFHGIQTMGAEISLDGLNKALRSYEEGRNGDLLLFFGVYFPETYTRKMLNSALSRKGKYISGLTIGNKKAQLKYNGNFGTEDKHETERGFDIRFVD